MADALDDCKREVSVHYSISGKNCPHILDYYGCSVRQRDRLPRGLSYIYMEFAPFGDLRDLIRKYESL
jgi:serine/threonine protein kinase